MPAKKTTKSARSTEPEPSFDQRLERLEELVREMESGELGLESAVERYQEGIGLLKSCHVILDGYRQQVEELGADAGAGTRPYAGDPDAAES